MYRLQTRTNENLIKLIILRSPTEEQLEEIFDKINKARNKFPSGYQLWIQLPLGLRAITLKEVDRIDLEAYTCKMKGLKKVVIEAHGHCPATTKVVQLLKNIYNSINIPNTVTANKADALRFLNLLWRPVSGLDRPLSLFHATDAPF